MMADQPINKVCKWNFEVADRITEKQSLQKEFRADGNDQQIDFKSIEVKKKVNHCNQRWGDLSSDVESLLLRLKVLASSVKKSQTDVD
jgi:hypothetical protein